MEEMCDCDEVSVNGLEEAGMVALWKLSDFIVLLADVILNDSITYIEGMTLHIFFS